MQDVQIPVENSQRGAKIVGEGGNQFPVGLVCFLFLTDILIEGETEMVKFPGENTDLVDTGRYKRGGEITGGHAKNLLL